MSNKSPERSVPLVYPSWLRLVSAGLVVVPILAAKLVWGEGPPQEAWQHAVPWFFLGVWLALSYQVFLIELSYDTLGVTYVSPLAGEVRLCWGEIVALLYVRGIDGYVLESGDGRRIWFNDWRTGMEDFSAAIQQRLPRQARGGC